jgi:GT2 family glycosyltransferase
LPSQIGGAPVLIVSEPRVGLGIARNAGWHSAEGDIIVFTDDDCYVAPDFIEAFAQAFSDLPQVGFIGGRILLRDLSDQRITILEDVERREFTPYSFVSAGAIQGANMAFRRRTLELIGGFDERLGAGTPFPCEDIDAVASALWLGIAGAYDPRPTVFHAHGRKTEPECRSLMAAYDAGRGAYYAKRLLDPRSRRTYLRAWCSSIWRELQEAANFAKSGRIHTIGRSRREIISAFRYGASRMWIPLTKRVAAVRGVST